MGYVCAHAYKLISFFKLKIKENKKARRRRRRRRRRRSRRGRRRRRSVN